MLILKVERRKIREYFRERVPVEKKDLDHLKHNEIDIKNLYIVKTC